MKLRETKKRVLAVATLALLSLSPQALLADQATEGEKVRETFEKVDAVLNGKDAGSEGVGAVDDLSRAQSKGNAGLQRSIGQKETKQEPSRSISHKIVNGKFFALVVGINGYKKINRLENAVNDARVVAEVLKSDYGFETTVLLEEQATRDNIMRSINELRKRLAEEDSLLIYYSGHGEFNKDTATSYWLPVDADYDDTTNWLEARSIADQLKLITAKHVLVVADSCFSGTMTRSADTSLRSNTTRENYLNKLFEKPSRVLIASGGNEPVTDAGAKGHSLFAAVFINALKKPFDKIFTAEELMARQLKESVAGRTDQTPEYKVIRNSGHDGGDFVFVRRK